MSDSDGLSLRWVGDELVVVDAEAAAAHKLDATRAAELLAAPGMDRRRLLQRAATVGAAGGLISIVLPAASAAASPVPGVGRTQPVVGLSGPLNPPGNASVTLTVVVAGAGTSIPSGTVSLFTRVGAVDTPVAGEQDKVLDGTGSQTFTVHTGLPGTSVDYVATYSGDPTYLPAEGTTTVSPVKVTPTVVVSDQGNANNAHSPSRYNPITVTVSGPSGVPTGAVDIYPTNATPTWINVSLDAAGQATRQILNGSAISGGLAAAVRAHYNGDALYNAADSDEFTYTFVT